MTQPVESTRPVERARPAPGGTGRQPSHHEPSRHDQALAEPEMPDGCKVAAAAAAEKLGRDTVVLWMGDLFGVVDAFVITSGRNARQVRTLVEEVERRVKEATGRSPSSVEGLRDAGWVLMDYGDFLVHVFLDETRDYYDLEHLWSGAPRVRWQERVAG